MTETPLYIELAKLQNAIDLWNESNFPRKQAHQPLLGVGEEMGELVSAYGRLCHAHLKMEQNIRAATQYDKEDAIGDMVIYLIDYCNQNNIDFANAITKTWDQVKQRDWKKFPKNGRSE